MSKESIIPAPKLLTATLAYQSQARLGEGSIWNYKTAELYWVDIESGLLHIFNPKSKTEKVSSWEQRISTVVPAEDGMLIVAGQNGLYKFDPIRLEKELLIEPPHDSSIMRFNDGKCDPSGRLWLGSMHLDTISKLSALYKVEKMKFAQMLSGITISNGICWSPDSRTMYYIDTPTHEVKAFDFDQVSGSISNMRVIIEMKDELSSPDGMTIDAEGMLWIAHWHGACVTRWDPQSSKMLCKVEVPAYNVTSCAFGGENLDTLYITSAREEMTEEQKLKFPLAGSLFEIKPGVKGVRCFFFKN